MDTERSISCTLVLDGIYYLQAQKAAKEAVEHDNDFSKWENFVRETNAEIDAIFSDPDRDDDDAHDLCVKLDRHWQSFDLSAARLIQHVAATHILCGTCLEAHINTRAEEALNGKDFAEFDKLSLVGKWLFYPKLVSKSQFEPGERPFQGLQLLSARRNALVHYKARRERTKHPYDLPSSLMEDLGLRANACRASLSTVREMVKALALMENRECPPWIDASWCSAFYVDGDIFAGYH